MVGKIVGGVNVFGGGLGLYNAGGNIGDLGLSSDTSCADHIIAWRVRNNPGLDFVPGRVSGDPARLDNIIYDFAANSNGGNRHKRRWLRSSRMSEYRRPKLAACYSVDCMISMS